MIINRQQQNIRAEQSNFQVGQKFGQHTAIFLLRQDRAIRESS